MSSASLPLAGRTALVTGVSRRRGIGYAVARTLAGLGASIVIHHYRPHDLDQPWGGDDLDAVRAGVRDATTADARFADVDADLTTSDGIARTWEAASGLTGHVDILVCNHARSGGDGSILDMTADTLDAFWQTDTRSTLLLTSLFARAHAPAKDAAARRPGERIEGTRPYDGPTGHVFWTTSGQQQGPMRGEVAYATSKAALAGVTATVAAELLELGIVLNTINPGPVNTGYLDPETTDRPVEELERMRAETPFGRYGRPDDPAALIGWLATGGTWVVGQVLTSDGGLGLG